MITGFIPLIMLIGKLVVRSRNKFFIDLSSFASPSSRVGKSKKGKTKRKVSTHLPAKAEKVRERREAYAAFKRVAQERLGARRVEQINPNFTLTREQSADLREAKNHFYDARPYPGMKRIRGGTHLVCMLDSIPGFVFKVSPGSSREGEYDAYVQRSQEARELIQSESLFLLDVPVSQVIEVDGVKMIMQEQVQIEHGSFEFQRGLHHALLADSDLRPYMKELYRQLAVFIAKYHFSDVKYDNISITQMGGIGLIDLDRGNAMAGFFRGAHMISMVYSIIYLKNGWKR